uniref:inactive serine protease 35 isoform X1 n=1 Tax=Callospermophilus lateralis TaxID=76772 RepID=UPI004038BE72
MSSLRTRKRNRSCPPSLRHASPLTTVPEEDLMTTLIPSFSRMSFDDPQSLFRRSSSTRFTELPTWGQLKQLTHQARELISTQSNLCTPEKMFVAMLAILACQVTNVSSEYYWAYYPDPPLFHLTTWGKGDIKVFTNNTNLLGGKSNSFITPISTHNFSFKGHSHLPPLCFSYNIIPIVGYIPLNYRTFMTNSPNEENDIKDLWMLSILALDFPDFKKNLPSKKPPSMFQDCKKAESHLDHSWVRIDRQFRFPMWHTCMFTKKGFKIFPKNSSFPIYDFSISESKYEAPKILSSPSWNTPRIQIIRSVPLEPMNEWFSAGWVAPLYFTKIKQHYQVYTKLYRLLASLDIIHMIRPSLVHESHFVTACVGSPYAILLKNQGTLKISKLEDETYDVVCEGCTLTNCIDPNISASNHILIVHKPSYVMLPVKLDSVWYDDPGLQALDSVNQALIRPKRFVATLILGISALIGIIGSIVASTTALVKEVHTAHHVNQLSKNISTALMIQEHINTKLEARVNALKEAVLYIGNQIQNIKTRMTTRCHSQYKWICVTPHTYNYSKKTWSQIQCHLRGLWKNTNLTLDIDELQEKIKDISQAHISETTIPELADTFVSKLNSLVSSKTLFSILINSGLSILIILVLIFVLPVLFRLLSREIRSAHLKLKLLHLKNKKGGIGGGDPPLTVLTGSQ